MQIISLDQKGAKVQSSPFEEGLKSVQKKSSLRPEVNYYKFWRCSGVWRYKFRDSNSILPRNTPFKAPPSVHFRFSGLQNRHLKGTFICMIQTTRTFSVRQEFCVPQHFIFKAIEIKSNFFPTLLHGPAQPSLTTRLSIWICGT